MNILLPFNSSIIPGKAQELNLGSKRFTILCMNLRSRLAFSMMTEELTKIISEKSYTIFSNMFTTSYESFHFEQSTFKTTFDFKLYSNLILKAFRVSEVCCLFQTRNILGRGSFKVAYEGIQIEFEAKWPKISSVAIVTIKNGPNIDNHIYEENIDDLIFEDNLAELFSSPHLIKTSRFRYINDDIWFKSAFLVQDRFAFDFGITIKNKLKYLKSNADPNNGLPEEDNPFPSLNRCIRAIKDVAKGLMELHTKGYFHGDIKPSNIAVKRNGRGLLFDLGFVEQLGSLHVRLTPLYAAPELIISSINAKQTYETDLWAFGLTLFEICSPHKRLPKPFLNLITQYDLKKAVLKITSDEMAFHHLLFIDWKAKNTLEVDLQNLIQKLLSVDPGKRGTVQELSKRLEQIYESLPMDCDNRRSANSIIGLVGFKSEKKMKKSGNYFVCLNLKFQEESKKLKRKSLDPKCLIKHNTFTR